MRYIILIAYLCLSQMVYAQNAAKPAADSSKPKPIYQYVDQMPEASVDLSSYLSKTIVYPLQAKKDNVEGRVTLKFIINEDGSTSDVTVVRGISKECDAEAVRVIKGMPLWKPGKQNGKAVKVFFTLPIVFRL